MPPVESEADRASYFDASEFGQLARISGVDIEGYFDEQTEFLEGLSPVSVQTTNPTFQCQTTKVPTNTAEGTAITVTRDDGTTFSGSVVTIEPDGFGLTLLTLENDE